VSGARLADTGGEEFRDDRDIQNVAGVDEGARGRCWKLRKARNGLLRGDEDTVDVDGRIMTEVGKGEGERVVRRGKVSGAGC
jgi:hypothetical protein